MEIIYIIIFIIVLIVAAIILRSIVRARGFVYWGADEVKNLKQFPRSQAEAHAIEIVEKILGKKFPTILPDWLVWKGRRIELDGYNKDLKLGIEFNGPLHTKFSPNKESYDEYYERLLKDIEKKRLCKQHGINLIVIDYSIPSHLMYNYISSRLFDLGLVSKKPYEYMKEVIVEPYRNDNLLTERSIRRAPE